MQRTTIALATPSALVLVATLMPAGCQSEQDGDSTPASSGTAGAAGHVEMSGAGGSEPEGGAADTSDAGTAGVGTGGATGADDAGSAGDEGSAGSAGSPSNDGDTCLVTNCFPELSACIDDEECSGWVTCIQECGDDKMKCPTFCGLYYPTPLANDFIECALEEHCMAIDFSDYPDCDVTDGQRLDLSGMDGSWWLAGYVGQPYVFDHGCQRFDFDEQSSTKLLVDFSIPLSREGQERMCETHGTFEQQDDGSVLVDYDNFLGYHEDWYVLYKTDDVVVADLCFASDGGTKDYGTVVLSREPLDALDEDGREELDEALENGIGVTLDQITSVEMTSCTNAADD